MAYYNLPDHMAAMVLTPPQRTFNPHGRDHRNNRRDFEGAIPSFDKVVLDQILAPLVLRPLVTKWRPNDGLALREHFRQYQPYIMAELLKAVNEKVESLESGRRNQRAPARMKREQDDVECVGSFVSVRLEISSKDMPKLDHGFYNELVALIPPDQGDETPLYFAVARLARGQRDE
eukprot:gene20498-15032_t